MGLPDWCVRPILQKERLSLEERDSQVAERSLGMPMFYTAVVS